MFLRPRWRALRGERVPSVDYICLRRRSAFFLRVPAHRAGGRSTGKIKGQISMVAALKIFLVHLPPFPAPLSVASHPDARTEGGLSLF
eukprot:7957033-Pyramimonas_sp.AAC.1